MLCWTIHLKGIKGCRTAVVTVGQKVYAFGEVKDSDQIGVHIFNTVSLRWTTLPPVTSGIGEHHLEVPSWLQDHTAVLIDDTVYVWGGRPYCRVLYAFDVNTHRWFKPRVSGTVPARRANHSACVLGKVMYIHGGRIQTDHNCNAKTYHNCNDVYKLDTTTMVWSLINTRGTPPPASKGHSATIIGTKMFVAGGWEWGQRYNTIRVFDTDTNCWLNTPSIQLHPEGRRGHSAFTFNGELYIFGGWNWNQTFNDLWKFSPETFCWKKVEPKGKDPIRQLSMGCCLVGDRIILFQGLTSPDDLYILDLNPSLKTLCKLAVIQYGLEQSGLPHNIRWELAAMTTDSN